MVKAKYTLHTFIRWFLFLVVGALALTSFSLAQTPSPASLESFYVGTLHLGFAATRASCQPPDRNIDYALVNRVVEDLQTARQGAEAMSACLRFDLSKFDVFRTQVPNRWSGVLRAVEGLYQDYQRAVASSSCRFGSNGPAQLESFYVGSLFMGFATARPTCFIPTWNAPLPHNVNAMIQRDLDTARTGIEAFKSALPNAAVLVAQLDNVRRNLGTVPGRQAYDNLTALHQRVQTAVRSSTPAVASTTTYTAPPPDRARPTQPRTNTRAGSPQRSQSCESCVSEKCDQPCKNSIMILCTSADRACQQCIERNCSGL
ncbi:MAG: hypothetical protein HYR55_08520 [Acidobacteria bacterium]|nr:hypothetical protein [Acidobacteriota bacterium]MBI3657744.1 hypothetical protein [Acidobacteriota bacterium]